jgi:hypothetical protein
MPGSKSPRINQVVFEIQKITLMYQVLQYVTDLDAGPHRSRVNYAAAFFCGWLQSQFHTNIKKILHQWSIVLGHGIFHDAHSLLILCIHIRAHFYEISCGIYRRWIRFPAPHKYGQWRHAILPARINVSAILDKCFNHSRLIFLVWPRNYSMQRLHTYSVTGGGQRAIFQQELNTGFVSITSGIMKSGVETASFHVWIRTVLEKKSQARCVASSCCPYERCRQVSVSAVQMCRKELHMRFLQRSNLGQKCLV